MGRVLKHLALLMGGMAIAIAPFTNPLRAAEPGANSADVPLHVLVSGTVETVSASRNTLVFQAEQVSPLKDTDPTAAAGLVGTRLSVSPSHAWGMSNVLHEAFLRTPKPGDTLTLDVRRRNLAEGNFRLMRLPGSDAPDFVALTETLAPLPPGAHVDESVIKTTLEVAGADPAASDTNDGSVAAPLKTISAALTKAVDNLEKGIATRVRIAPGVYRESAGVMVFPTGLARQTALVIEGTDPQTTIWSGADEWPADQWEDIGEGVFARAWPHEFGHYTPQWGVKNYLGQRCEMVFIDGVPLKQTLIEEIEYSATGKVETFEPRQQTYTYKTTHDPRQVLEPGTFGVTERDDTGEWSRRIFVKPVEPAAFAKARVEVATRRLLVGFGDKDNLVLRNLTFQHSASHEGPREPSNAVQFFNNAAYRNVLIDRCRFLWNNSSGLDGPTGGAHWTIRNSQFNHNGFSGIAGRFHSALFENNQTNFNNWRGFSGGVTSWYVAGAKFHNTEDHVVNGHESIGNLAPGFWYDIHCERVNITDLVTALNTRNLFIELSNGPFEIERCLSVMPTNRAFNSSIVTDYTVQNSIFHADGGESLQEGEPMPVFHSQWYERSDEHARQRPLRTGTATVQGNVIVGGTQQKSLVNEMVPINRPGPYESYQYVGRDNTYFLPGEDATAFSHTDSNWKRHPTDFASWISRKNETNSVWVDPGFVNPAALDFRLRDDSPLKHRESELPARRIDPSRLEEAKAFFNWAGYTGQKLETLDQ